VATSPAIHFSAPLCKEEYHKRRLIEAVNSFLRTQCNMTISKIRGLKQVASYALFSLLCLVLNREAAQNIGRADKVVPPTCFAQYPDKPALRIITHAIV